MTFARLGDHTIFLSAINSGATVIDAGFNKGEFSAAILANVDCRIVALEPLSHLVQHAAHDIRIDLSQRALASTTGQRRFREFDGHCASLHQHREGKLKAETIVEAVSVADLMRENDIHHVELLKLDIEGEEIDVLSNLSDQTLESIDQITVEFHFELFPEHRKEYIQICRRFLQIGYLSFNFSTKPGTDTLFIRERLIDSFSPRLKLWAAAYRLGIARIVRRKMAREPVDPLAKFIVGR